MDARILCTIVLTYFRSVAVRKLRIRHADPLLGGVVGINARLVNSDSVNPLSVMLPTKTTAGVSAALFGIALLAAPSFSFAKPPSAAASFSAKQGVKDDVAAAKSQLAAASAAVDAAETAADQASAQLPRANRELSRAQAAVTTSVASQAAAEKVHDDALAVQVQAEQSYADAQSQVQAAEAAVTEQRREVVRAQEEMDQIKGQISALARQRYIAGNESIEFSILMQSKDPAEFAAQLLAIARISRGNASLFSQTNQLQEELAAELGQLNELENAADDRAAEAGTVANQAEARAGEARAKAVELQVRVNQASSAVDAAAAAKASIAGLVAQREQELDKALALRRAIKSMYERLQAKLLAAQGVAKTSGTGRDAKAALAWGMRYVGSGAQYDGLCLGFVDDAYAASSGRVGTAIAQWYRAKGAGVARPGDRNPPLGAQVFWLSGNPAKHVAIYAGGGMVLTTGAEGGRVGLVTMEYLDGYGPYLGWAEAYYG